MLNVLQICIMLINACIAWQLVSMKIKNTKKASYDIKFFTKSLKNGGIIDMTLGMSRRFSTIFYHIFYHFLPGRKGIFYHFLPMFLPMVG